MAMMSVIWEGIALLYGQYYQLH